jgi:hypothetical protein
MAKAFFGAFLLVVVAVLWVSIPRAIMRTCPVCQGRGTLPSANPIMVGKGDQWVEKTELLCPFCDHGRISLYDLRLHRSQMIRWMVKEQKLAPEVLLSRVKDGFGEAGLDDLHANNFYMDEK